MKRHAACAEFFLQGDVEPDGALIEPQHIHMRRASCKPVMAEPAGWKEECPGERYNLDPASTSGIASPGVDTKEELKPFLTPFRCFLGLLFLAVMAGVVYLLIDHRSGLIDLAHRTTAFVRDQGPVPFFAALAFLPAVGLPVSAFYLAAGAVFPLWVSLVGTTIGLAINIILTYWMARKWFRVGIERLLRRTRYKIPVVALADHVRLTLFLRLMPGPPFCLQSFILGMIKVPFPTYFLISIGTQILIASGMIVLGSAFYSSSFGRALIAIIIVVLVAIIIQWTRRLLGRRVPPSDPAGKAEH
jgi:uncharacterized membrane protein YdjX (TVP38/TMEM64 family)